MLSVFAIQTRTSPLRAGAVAVLAACFSWPAHAQSCEQVFAQLDNDFTLLTDEGYTSGVRIGCEVEGSSPNIWPGARTAVLAGHAIYTPANISQESLVSDDQPYAGHAYLQSAVWEAKETGLSRLDLQLGLVGPLAGGKFLQSTIHRIGGFARPRGWENQIGHELTANIRLGHIWSLDFGQVSHDAGILPYVNLAGGNVLTAATAGTLLRIGRFDTNSYPYFNGLSEPPGSPASSLGQDKFVLFAGVELRATGRDLFLDGRVFDKDHSVDREPFVGLLRFGAQTEWRGIGLGFVQTLHTKLFEGDGPHGYGSLFVAIGF